jgi:DNA-directed RNA polymerase specialized sigma24 family protein
MKVPSNMTEEEVIAQINKVIDRISPKYTFYGYDVNDIKQESFIICLDALDRYDEARPLENFLSVHLSNRLKNFVRDNYSFSNNNEKRKVSSPMSLSYEENVEKNETTHDVDFKDMDALITERLPARFRSDYLKFIHNVSMTKAKKEKIIAIIKEILGDIKNA